MTHQVATNAEEAQANALYKTSGAAALLAGAFLAIAAMHLLVTTILQPGTPGTWLSLLENNWLIVLFKLHAGFPGVQHSLLYGLNAPDILPLVLSAIMYMGLFGVLRDTSRLLSTIALVQPFLGFVLFVVTRSAGRSAVMGAELVISFVMVRSKLFEKRIAMLGILSALLLLAGDIGASLAPSMILAICVGTGYMLLVSWLLLVGLKLFQCAQSKYK